MNFFEQQARARSQSKRLVSLFALAVVAIVVAISTVVAIALEFMSDEPVVEAGSLFARHAGAVTAAAILTLAVIFFASLYKTIRLRAGGGVVARQLGGTLVSTDVGDPKYRRLRNVVEEIAIASGVPVPEIYVLEDELGINAFAAGYTPADAAIAVTRGALDHLSRDELQGVIAHEFSHVLNGDMRLNIKLMGVLFGILVIGVIAREIVANSRGSRSKDGNAFVLAALAIMIVGYIGLFFGRLIKAGLSRQREYLADASAVQFTRQNRGIAGALRKIGQIEQGSKIATPDVEEVSHMLFGDGVGYSRLFATHPALEERLKRLDPRNETRDVSIETTDAGDASAAEATPPPAPKRAATAAIPGIDLPGLGTNEAAAAAAVSMLSTPTTQRTMQVAASDVSAQVGNPSSGDYRVAAEITLSIPEALRVAAHMQDQAPALVLALALDPEESAREQQLGTLGPALGADIRERVEAYVPQIAGLHPMQRLPLAALAFPALRRRPRPFLLALNAALDAIIRADAKVQLAEYCLARLVTIQVLDSLDPSQRKVMGRRKIGDLLPELMALLATLAAQGNGGDEAAARRAYVAGIQGLVRDGTPPYAPPGDPVAALDVALPKLDALDPAGKELVVEALVRVMAHDGRVDVAEAELLRTVCAALHCPLPPLLADAA